MATVDISKLCFTYSSIWEINKIHFPNIRLFVKDSQGNPRIGILLNLRDFDYMPPGATIMDIHFKRFLVPQEVPAMIEGTPDGRPHIMFNQITRRCWFCSPGLREYHDFYKEDPWEQMRGTDSASLTSIINNICDLIDRKKWVKGQEGGI